MVKLKDKRFGLVMVPDEIRRNQEDKIVAVHIPLIGWKSADEFEVIEEDPS